MDYAAPGWQSFLSSTNMDKLEKAQNQAFRAITGQYSSTPLEALRIKSGFQSYATHSKRLTAASQQKAFRLSTEHPRAVALSSTVPRRLKRSSWKSTAQELLSAIPVELEKRNYQQPDQEKPPWEGYNTSNWTVADTLAGARTKCPKETTLDVLRNLKGDIYLYTDGSASHGNENGGYAVVAGIGDQASTDVIAKLRKRGRAIASSFDEVKAAVLTVSWLMCNQQRGTTAVICTDSQSFCTALWKRNSSTTVIRSFMDSHHSKVVIQWIPGHSDLAWNELADSESRKTAVTTTSEAEPTSLRAALSFIKRTFKDPEPCHHCAKFTYKDYNYKAEAKKTTSKKDAVLLAQLRSGHCKLLKAYVNLLDPTVNPTCPLCTLEPQTLEHWLNCPATAKYRLENFGTCQTRLKLLTEAPNGRWRSPDELWAPIPLTHTPTVCKLKVRNKTSIEE